MSENAIVPVANIAGVPVYAPGAGTLLLFSAIGGIGGYYMFRRVPDSFVPITISALAGGVFGTFWDNMRKAQKAREQAAQAQVPTA